MAGTILLQLASDHGGPDPGLQISLLAWLILPYVVGGLIPTSISATQASMRVNVPSG
jgi:hypothetical protein